MNVGFIGLGLMGRPLAQHLAAAGHSLHLWARRPESLAAFAESGARTHPTSAEVARHADVVITMVADAPDVRAVTLGADGIAAGGRPGLIVIDMSTINPNAAREIGAELTAQGIDFLDAPVSGGQVGAINATLTIMVGGKADAFEKARPLFEKMGKSITLIGGSGAEDVTIAHGTTGMVIDLGTGADRLTLGGRANAVRLAGVAGDARQDAVLPGRLTPERAGGDVIDRQFFAPRLDAAVLARVAVALEHVSPAERHGDRRRALVLAEHDRFRHAQRDQQCVADEQ